MNTVTLELFDRMRAWIPEGRPWFDLLQHWYKHTRLTYRALEELTAEDALDLLKVAVNHDPESTHPERHGMHVEFPLAASRLVPGDNSLVVQFSHEAGDGFPFDAAMVGVPGGSPLHAIRFDTKRPESPHAFQLSASGETVPGSNHWALQPGGFLVFRLNLAEVRPVMLTLRMPIDASFPLSKTHRDRRRKLLGELRKIVQKKVKEKIREVEARLRRDAEAGRELDDLQNFEVLDELQIEPAVESGNTLQEEIDLTGQPDDLVSRPPSARQRPVELRPAPEQVIPLQQVRPPNPPTVQPVRMKAVRVARRAAPAAKAASGGGWFGKLVLAGLLTGIPAAGVAVWTMPQLAPAKQWIQAKLNLPGAGQGDVLAALKASAQEQGWSRIEAKQLTDAQMKKMLEAGKIVGNNDPNVVPANAKVFFCGQRMAGADLAGLEEELGFPLCSDFMVVYQLQDAAQAGELWKVFRNKALAENQSPLMKQMGLENRLDAVTVANADEAYIQNTNKGTITGAMIRRGRYMVKLNLKVEGTPTELDYRTAMASVMGKLAKVP